MRVRSVFFFFFFLFLISGFSFSQDFSVKRYPTGSGPSRLVRADFNGDGKQDLASVDSDGSRVSVLLGNGDGSFQLPQDYIVGPNPKGLVSADVNHDGKKDLVTMTNEVTATDTSGRATAGRDTIYFLLGNGDGSFQPARAVTVPWHGYLGSIVAADFNKDGNIDFAVSEVLYTSGENSSVVRILYGNGSAGISGEADFVNPGQQPAQGEGRYLVESLEVGDFNKDGWTDLVIWQDGGGFDVPMGAIWVMLNNHAGGFTQNAVTTLSVPTGVAVFDINGDGKDDILSSYRGCHTPCSGWTSFLGNGDGTFVQGPGQDDDQLFFYFPTVIDFNGDGIRDIVWSATNTHDFSGDPQQDFLFFYARNADGTLGSRQQVALGAPGERVLPVHLVNGDYNNDGKPDIAVADSVPDTISIALNSTAPSTACTLKATNPSVTICSPAQGATVASPVHVLAYGQSSPAVVTTMQLYVDNSLNQNVRGNTLDVNVTLPAGNHFLVVKGWNSAGKSFSDFRTITVSGSTSSCIPSTAGAQICSPSAGSSVSSPFTLKAGARAASGNITAIRVYVDNTAVYTLNNPSATTTEQISTSLSLATGNHNIVVIGYQSAGGSVKASETITVR